MGVVKEAMPDQPSGVPTVSIGSFPWMTRAAGATPEQARSMSRVTNADERSWVGLMIGVGRGANSAGEEIQQRKPRPLFVHPVNLVPRGQPGSRTHQHSNPNLMDLLIIGISTAFRRGGSECFPQVELALPFHHFNGGADLKTGEFLLHIRARPVDTQFNRSCGSGNSEVQ